MRFTTETVAKLVCPENVKDVLVFDEDLPGFGCRVTRQGGRTFLVQFRAGGTRRRLVLGRFGVLTPEQARKAARAALGRVAAGFDPFAEREAQVEAARAENTAKEAKRVSDAFTVRKLVDDWLADRAESRRPSYLNEARRCLARNLGGLLDRPAAEITVVDAVRALDAVKVKSGFQANRSLAYMRAAFSWAVRRQMVAANPFRGLERPVAEHPRERVLTVGELGAIWRACGTIGEPYGNAIRLLLLTVGRREEVAGARWTEFDDVDAPMTWTLPGSRSKNRRAHVTHLAEPARQILGSIPRRVGSDLVFHGRSGASLTGWSGAMRHLRAAIEAAGDDVAPWRLHDFRRAAVTHLAASGVAPHVADRLLNHVTGTISGVAAVYQRHGFEKERRAALDHWAAVIVASAERREMVSNVVALRA